MEKFLNELSSVWNDFSDEARDNWAILLGGKNGKSEVMAIMSKEDDI